MRRVGRATFALVLGWTVGCSSKNDGPGAVTARDGAVGAANIPPAQQLEAGIDAGDEGMRPGVSDPSSAPDAGAGPDARPRDATVATVPPIDAGDAPAPPTRDVLLVANKDVGAVEFFDAKSFAKLGSLNVISDGKDPQDPFHAPIYAAIVLVEGLNYAQHILLAPDGATLYVARGWLGDVAAFDLASKKQKWRLQTTSFRADHMALNADGSKLFVSALSADQVQVIDPVRGAFVGMFPTGTWPHGMEFSHDGKKLYTGSIGNILLPEGMQGRYELTVTDPSSLKTSQAFTFDAGIRPFVIGHDDKLMYTQLSWFHGVAEVDLASGATLRQLELPVGSDAQQVPRADYPNDAAHHGLAISHDGETLCAAGTLSDYAALVSRSSLTLLKTIPVGDEPGWTVTSPDGQYCFVGSRGSKTVSAISYAEQKEVARFSVGGLPQHLLVAKIPESVLRAAGFL